MAYTKKRKTRITRLKHKRQRETRRRKRPNKIQRGGQNNDKGTGSGQPEDKSPHLLTNYILKPLMTQINTIFTEAMKIPGQIAEESKENVIKLVGQLQQMVDLDNEQFRKLADGLSKKMDIFVEAAGEPLDKMKVKITNIMNQFAEKSGLIVSNGVFGLMKGVPGLGATLSILGIANTVAAGAEMTAEKANDVLKTVSDTIDNTMSKVGIVPNTGLSPSPVVSSELVGESRIPSTQNGGYANRIHNSIKEFKNTDLVKSY